MTLTEHYSDYKWIKVKQFKIDQDGTWKNNFIALEEHHLKEATFLINEVRILAAMVDERDKRLEEIAKVQNHRDEQFNERYQQAIKHLDSND